MLILEADSVEVHFKLVEINELTLCRGSAYSGLFIVGSKLEINCCVFVFLGLVELYFVEIRTVEPSVHQIQVWCILFLIIGL